MHVAIFFVIVNYFQCDTAALDKHYFIQVLFEELRLDKNVQKRLARTQIKNYKSTSENVVSI